MSTLKIALLGPPEVFHFDQRLHFSDRKTFALLAYLATENGMHKRQQLSQLLWPDSDAEHGRTALRIALHRLRRMLEEGAEPEHEDHLLVTHDALGLNRNSDIELDLHELQAAWSMARGQAVREAAKGEARRSLLVHLQHAATLYRSGFLETFALHDTVDFDDWVSIQRGYWYQRIEQVLDWLSQLQSAEGQIEQAIATVERWRSLDPLNEDISLRLMQLQFAAGNRIAALRTYETYRNVLRRELGARPSSRLVAQAEFLRHATAPPGKRTHQQQQSTPPYAHSLLQVPFVGRELQLHRLLSLYESAVKGQPQVVVVEGEAGIGKTRLAAAFLEWARGQGAQVFEGRAFQSYQHLAYQPILDPLRVYLEQEQDLRHLLSTAWLTELSRLLPEVRERYPDLPAPTTDETFEAARFFEALARLGEAYAARAPLLIFVDDLQWIDRATLDLFQYLLRRWREHAAPIFLLLCRRVETRSMEPWLVEWFASLKRDVPLSRMELGPLSAQDILQIAQSVSTNGIQSATTQQPPTATRFSALPVRSQANGADIERFGNWLYTQTKGQPFFVDATLEALLERGGLVPHFTGHRWVFEPRVSLLASPSPDISLPSDVREMIQLRLARLSPPAHELLAAGAVLDHDFTFESLCQVAHLAPQDGLIALDEVLENLLLRAADHQSDKQQATVYRFVHDKFREAAYAAAGEARRRMLHGRALYALEREGGSAAVLAYHALNSGSAEPAFRWSKVAGDEAMAVFATRNAIAHYEQARQLVGEGKVDASVTDLHHLYSELGRAYELRNDARAAQAIYQTMLETARSMHNAEMECVALNRKAVLEGEDFSRLEPAMTLLQEALTLAGRNHDQSCLAETYWSLARVNYYALKLEESLVYGRRAYALMSELGKPDLAIRILNILSYTMKALGRWEEAASLAEEAWQLAVQQGNRVMEGDCLARVADARINFGHPREGVAAARAAYAISLEIEHAWSQALSGYTLARGLLEIGSYEEALAIALRSTEAARALTFNILLIVNLLTLGMVYQALLLPRKAMAAYQEALTLSEPLSAKRYVSLSSSLLCAVAVSMDDWEAASRYVKQAQAARERYEVIFAEAPRWPETVALLYFCESEQADQDLEHFRELFGTNKRCFIVLARAQAVLAEWRGKNEQAIEYVQAALTEARTIDLPGEVWQAEVALGKLYLACKEHEQAEQAFTRATSIMEQLADAITEDELRQHFLAQARLLIRRELGKRLP